jgi:carbon-monoxide dehydrogenase medium subunit
MYPESFDYYRASTPEEAIELLEEHADVETELLAGGHSLIPTMKSRLAAPDVVVDVGGISSLDAIDEYGDGVRIGALTTYADVASSTRVSEASPTVSEAAGEIGDVQVRSRGTIGGNIAHADPASDLPAAVLAADATVHAVGPNGEREIDIDDFFVAIYTTALGEDELLTHVDVPSIEPTDAGAYVKKPSPSSGYALIGVAATVRTNGSVIESARVAANGTVDHAIRLPGVEDELGDRTLDEETASQAASRAGENIDSFRVLEDLQASSEYRQQLLQRYTEDALKRAFSRVENTG